MSRSEELVDLNHKLSKVCDQLEHLLLDATDITWSANYLYDADWVRITVQARSATGAILPLTVEYPTEKITPRVSTSSLAEAFYQSLFKMFMQYQKAQEENNVSN